MADQARVVSGTPVTPRPRKEQIIRTLARCATGAAAVELLACLFQIPAAYICARLNSRAALALILATTVLQAALGIKMIGFILL